MLLTLVLMMLACKDDKDAPADDSTPPTDDSSIPNDGDGDGYSSPSDCDDGDPEVHPDADERCDGVDNDCDGDTDEDPVDPSTFYEDADGDGHGVTFRTETACSAPDGYAALGDDCDDDDPERHPGASERCNDEDDNCDGSIDEGSLDPVTWYYDGDGDGYGTDGNSIETCEPPADYVDNTDDCDDSNSAIHPGAPETSCTDPTDYNCDGTVGYTDGDSDGFAACEECDDSDPAIHPDATEVCDGADNDCDNRTDDEDTSLDLTTASTWYTDVDGDGHGDPNAVELACDQPPGATTSSDDCDDAEPDAWPGNTEICDGVDNDCEGSVDGPDATGTATWYADADGDGFGDPAFARTSCAQPTGYVADNTDCDDAHAEANPLGTEVCDTLDNDCDGSADGPDAADVLTIYPDSDGDGYGLTSGLTLSCTLPSGYSLTDGDCDDAHAEANPLGVEVCDGLDNDCSGQTDGADAQDAVAYFTDADQDSFGDPATGQLTCAQPSGTVTDNTDCDDAHAEANPLGVEVCDGLDNDCEGTTDGPDAADILTIYTDADSDGFGDPATAQLSCSVLSGAVLDDTDCDDGDGHVYPGAADAWYDGVDSDCAGDNDYDADGDGYDAPAGGGGDCHDDDPSRYPGSGPLSVPGDYGTIQAAIDDACDGDTVEVSAGTWSEALSISADITLDGVDGAASTTLSPPGGSSAVSIFSAGPIIRGFTLSGGVAADGAGLYASDCDGVVLEDLIFRDNVASDDGGGAYFEDCRQIRIASSTFAANGAGGYGGGLAVLNSNTAPSCADLELDAVVFDSNYASASGRGGGLYMDCDLRNNTGDAALTEVELTDNVCEGQSAGAYFEATHVVWTGGTLSGNSGGSSGDGGGLRLRDGSFTGSDLLFSENRASQGAGLYGADTLIDLSDSQFSANVAEGGVAALYATASDTTLDGVDFIGNWSDASGVLKLSGNGSTFDLDDLHLIDNGSSSAGYYAVYVQGSGTLDNLLVAGNEDGGLYLYPDAVTSAIALSQATVVGNAGTGITARPSWVSQITVVNTISAHNTGYGLTSTTTSYTPVVRYSDVYGNTSGAYSGMSTATGSNGNIAADPLFTTWSGDLSALRWDLHPESGSPALDAGDPAVTDADGSASDMGVYGGPGGDLSWWDDGDGDGLPDGWEALRGLDTASDDSGDDDDGDGLSNAIELARGTDPGDPDTDRDGAPDGDEVLDGTDPLAVEHSTDADFHGPTSSDYAGRSVAPLGDSDNDGNLEILIGANGASAVYLLEAPFSANSLAQTVAMARFSVSRAGSAVDGGADLNADGVEDVLLSDTGSAGVVYLFHGPFTGTLTTADADRSYNGEATGSSTGSALAFIEDLDGDGDDELLVGAPGYDYRATNDGGAYLVLGGASSGTLGNAAARIYGESAGDALGTAVADGGDLNGDGLHDIVLGAPSADPNGSGSGQAVVLFGPASGLYTSLVADALVQGPDATAEAGTAVCGAGDTDGDGYDDLLLGGPGMRDDSGAAWLVLGPIAAEEQLSAADATLYGEHVDNLAGFAVSAADIDGDGAPDLLVGGYGHESDRGIAWAVLSPVSGTFDLVDADRKVEGYAAGDQFGASIAGVGDVNADGSEDWLVGSPLNDTPANAAGAAWLIHGGF